MATNEKTSDKNKAVPDSKKNPVDPKDVVSDPAADTAADKAAQDITEDSPQAQPDYKPTENVMVDNRRSDYDQAGLKNPDSQAIHRDIFEDGNKFNKPHDKNSTNKDGAVIGDRAENHKGDPAWDSEVKQDDAANQREAQRNAPKVIVQQPPLTTKK